MCIFRQILPDNNFKKYENLKYIQALDDCYQTYSKFLQDDFAKLTINNLYDLVKLTSPYFWIVQNFQGRNMGFVYLDNFVGNERSFFSAEITTCFDKSAWGIFPRYSAKIFLKKVFDELGLEKIKAQIYPDNYRVKRLLKACGFVYEATLKKDTIRFGRYQDIDVFGLYRSYYYNKR